jgi:hypothetical protein
MQDCSTKNVMFSCRFLFKKFGSFVLVTLISIHALAQPSVDTLLKNNKIEDKPPQKQLSMEIYGFILADAIYDFKQMDPNWFDVPRPTKLPAHKDQFAPDGKMIFSVRQTRFGVRGYTPTPVGDLKTWFEFDLFGSGADAGQTTFHLRHAYGEIGKFGVGQTWSPFVDADLFPNDLEYWGPNGMANIRSLQIRYMPLQGDSKFTIALEKPGATADDGVYADYVELKNVKPHFTLPDLTSEYRRAMPWGYIELAGLLRQLKWKDIDSTGKDLSGQKVGWGFNLSSKIKILSQDAIHLQVLYGEGIESYVRDAPADVGIKNNGSSAEGVPLPVLGLVGFYDHYWSKKFSSTLGYSQVKITNSNGQSPSAFKFGEYMLGDLIYYPAENVIIELEIQYLTRKNFSDGWSTTDPRIQFGFRYNFSQKFYHESKTTP